MSLNLSGYLSNESWQCLPLFPLPQVRDLGPWVFILDNMLIHQWDLLDRGYCQGRLCEGGLLTMRPRLPGLKGLDLLCFVWNDHHLTISSLGSKMPPPSFFLHDLTKSYFVIGATSRWCSIFEAHFSHFSDICHFIHYRGGVATPVPKIYWLFGAQKFGPLS